MWCLDGMMLVSLAGGGGGWWWVVGGGCWVLRIRDEGGDERGDGRGNGRGLVRLTACDEAVVVGAEAGLVEVGEDVGLEVCCEGR